MSDAYRRSKEAEVLSDHIDAVIKEVAPDVWGTNDITARLVALLIVELRDARKPTQ